MSSLCAFNSSICSSLIAMPSSLSVSANAIHNVMLADEMLTPDSSRFWPLKGYESGIIFSMSETSFPVKKYTAFPYWHTLKGYESGRPQPSFDKQFVRDWLKGQEDGADTLPEEIVAKTVEKYEEAYELLTGEKFS